VRQRVRRERECVKEERLGGEENYGACVEIMRRLALLPQAYRRSLALHSEDVGPVETLESVVSGGPMRRVL
jgi:hypothetical protein